MSKHPIINSTVLDWATQFYCAKEDHEMIESLLRLRDSTTGTLNGTTRKQQRDQLLKVSEPLHILVYKARQVVESIGPKYLGQNEGDAYTSWTTLDLDKYKSPSKNPPNTLEPFTIQTQTPVQKPPRISTLNPEKIDIPSLIYSLITIENARQYYCAAGPNKVQSERWLHHISKRNMSLEVRFESIIVALKELLVLRAIVDPKVYTLGELKYTFSEPKPVFDPAQCLAVINLMFPIDPLIADRRRSLDTNKWNQRYAFPLSHVPNPRSHLVRLLNEVELWLCAFSFNLNDTPPPKSKAQRIPKCSPAWITAAQEFNWGQLKLSCLAYLRDSSNQIIDHHARLFPWPEVPSELSRSSDLTITESPQTTRNNESSADTDLIIKENASIVADIARSTSPRTTVVERVAHHSVAIRRRFSPYIVMEHLAQ